MLSPTVFVFLFCLFIASYAWNPQRSRFQPIIRRKTEGLASGTSTPLYQRAAYYRQSRLFLSDREDNEDNEEFYMDDDDESRGQGAEEAEAGDESPPSPDPSDPSDPSKRPASGRKRRKRSQEELKYFHEVTSRMAPTVDHLPPVSRFAQQFVAVGLLPPPPPDASPFAPSGPLLKRAQAWTEHMQWVRRPSLLSHAPPLPASLSPPLLSSLVEIERDLTLLSQDRLLPRGQLLLLRAESREDAERYLAIEPLSYNQALTWQLFEAVASEDEALACTTISPFLFLHFSPLSSSPSSSPSLSSLLRESRMFHRDTARELLEKGPGPEEEEEGVVPLSHCGYPRPALLVSLLEQGQERGQVLLFNARTNSDALAYLSLCPLGGRLLGEGERKGEREEEMVLERVSPPSSLTFLSPVNSQDVSGRHQVVPRSLAQRELEEIHYMDPHELLLLSPPSSSSTSSSASPVAPPEHYQENEQTVAYLHQTNSLYKYKRFKAEKVYSLLQSPLSSHFSETRSLSPRSMSSEDMVSLFDKEMTEDTLYSLVVPPEDIPPNVYEEGEARMRDKSKAREGKKEGVKEGEE